MKKNIVPILAVIIFTIAISCSDKATEPKSTPFEGVWQEEFLSSFSLDPGDFVFFGDDSLRVYDTTTFEPPDSAYIIDPGDSLIDGIVIFDPFYGHYYELNAPLVSELTFHDNDFILRIKSGEKFIEKELSGQFEFVDDTIFFNIRKGYFRYYEYFNIPYDIEVNVNEKMIYKFDDNESVYLSNILETDSLGVGTIEYIGFLWYLPSEFLRMKNFGTFDRVE